VALGVPGRLRPWIILTFGATRVVGRQPYALAAFTPGEIPGTHFQRLSQPQGTRFCQNHRKNPQWHHRESIPGPSTSSAAPPQAPKLHIYPQINTKLCSARSTYQNSNCLFPTLTFTSIW